MKNNKIAIVVCALPPSGGGIGNNAYYQAKELAKLGYQVTIFTPDYQNVEKISESSFMIEYLPTRFAIGKAGFLTTLKDKLVDFDIVHMYHPFFGTDLLVKNFKKKHPDKKVVIHYQMDPVGQGVSKIIFKLYFKLFLGGIVKMADKIGVLSYDHGEHSYLRKYLKNDRENKNNSGSKFFELPNGIDTNIFKPKGKNLSLMKKLGLVENNKVILFVGGLDSQHFFKGVDVLLKSVSKIIQTEKTGKNIKLIIIGDGNLKNGYIRQAKKLGLDNHVIFPGWVDNDELPDYYRLADIFTLPSTESTESFGIVVAEAQACGVPAVVSNWSGVRTTLEKNRTGFLVEPKSVNDLSVKIAKLLTDEELRKTMGEKAVIYASRFSWDRIIKKIIKVYENL